MKIVGYFLDSSGAYHGFIYDYSQDLAAIESAAGNMRVISVKVIDYPGAHSTQVLGINSHNVIVGRAKTATGSYFGIIGRPR